MDEHILIVGTVPYNKASSSRAFEAYFHDRKKENMAQIFSHPKAPCKGHCHTLYQITDHRLLKRWFNKNVNTGRIYQYDELEDEWADNEFTTEASVKKAYKLGAKHTPFTRLMRGLLWRKKYWCTDQFKAWLDDFKPDCVFLSFSDDYFIPRIAYYVAKRYDIPIISSIGDDYYFNKHFSLSPLYQLYKETYKKLIRKVLKVKGSAIYISDKIRDKYNSEFGLDGETVYLTSEIPRREFRPVNKQAPRITYFGNIRMGRNRALNDIGHALGEIDDTYHLDVYSNERDEKYYRLFADNAHVNFCGAVPYSEVMKKMLESDITVIVEGFAEKEIELSRYSLSTKAADSLASGVSIFTYGSQECGIIEYMQSTNASMVCTDRAQLKECLLRLIEDRDLQQDYYRQAIEITQKHHNLARSCEVFESVVKKAMQKG